MIARYRRIRKVYFILLVIAISFMSVGFASFSDELTISSNAIVKPDYGEFRVAFSSSDASFIDNEEVAGTIYLGDPAEVKAGYATIDNEGSSPSISNLTASFNGHGVVVYEFYIYNKGAYYAYLTDIKFNNVKGKDSNKVCTAMDGSVVSDACNGVGVGIGQSFDSLITSTTTGISDVGLGVNEYQKLQVYIVYSGDATDDFSVEFGDIQLVFSSVG